MTTRPTYTLTIQALDHRPQPPEIRLRQLLKIALRAFGFQAIEVREAGQSIEAGCIADGEPIEVDREELARAVATIARPLTQADEHETPGRHFRAVHHGD